jgi:transposase
MTNTTTRPQLAGPALMFALEIGTREWKVATTVGLGQAPRIHTIRAGDFEALVLELLHAKRRFGLAADVQIVSCYEAGRCGFWPHRALQRLGIHNLVVDSSSIEVNRRQRRAKTDRLDAWKLVLMLARYLCGDDRVWSVVRVPEPIDEDFRQLQRQIVTLTRERARTINRVKGLLATQGGTWAGDLSQVRCWDGDPLPRWLYLRCAIEVERREVLDRQIKRLMRERRRMARTLPKKSREQLRRLMNLKAIGPETAWLLEMEFFAWRPFGNVKQLASLAGLAGTPYQSGDSHRELGISKSGNRLIRWIMIEAAWRWLRFQPESELSRWYVQRFSTGGRLRRIGIVALARKLLCALWRYIDQGVLPAGAMLKS